MSTRQREKAAARKEARKAMGPQATLRYRLAQALELRWGTP